MSNSSTSADDRNRITARLSQSLTDKLTEAAELIGTNLNTFLVQSALKEANRIIERETFIRLTRNDAAMLVKSLEAPSKINGRLANAFARLKEEEQDGNHISALERDA